MTWFDKAIDQSNNNSRHINIQNDDKKWELVFVNIVRGSYHDRIYCTWIRREKYRKLVK
jgi:hypothetical protein